MARAKAGSYAGLMASSLALPEAFTASLADFGGSAGSVTVTEGVSHAAAPRAMPSVVRFVGFAGLAGVLILLAAFAAFAFDLRRQLQRNAAQNVQSAAYLLADHASRLVEVADVALRGAAAAVQGQNWETIEHSTALFDQLRTMRSALPYVEDIWLNDSHGRLRLTTFGFPTPYADASDRDVFVALLQPTARIFVGERITGRVTTRPTFVIAKRLEEPGGGLRGMVSVTADLAYFKDYWARIHLPLDARVTLLRGGYFDKLAQFPDVNDAPTFATHAVATLRAAIADAPEGGRYTLPTMAGVGARIVAYQRVGDLPLYVTIGVSQAAISAEWRARLLNYAIFAAAASLGFAALALLGFRQARREAVAATTLERARTALIDANGRLESTVAARTQELRVSEAELRASEGWLRLILQSATYYAIITTDLAGSITHWNKGAEDLLGWSPAEAVGHSAGLVFLDDPDGDLTSVLGRALAEGRISDERWHRRRDGSRFFASLATLLMHGDGGAAVGFLIILRDRTEEFAVQEAKRTMNETLARLVADRTAELEAANRRLVDEAAQRQLAEEQLRQSQKMEAVGRLTGGVAHDFNNLLTVITGNLEMLSRHLQDGSGLRSQRLIERAMEGANRAAILTHRLLAFSRQQPLAPEAVDINRLVAGMSDLLQRTLPESIAVQTVLAGGLWRTHVDPNQLESALLNLAVNARDATGGGGMLTIETANTHLDEAYAASHADVATGHYVMVAVSDTGTGMPPDTLARAFEPFFTTKPVGKGTGLGLSQVFGFVKQSGGHAAIYSEIGHGTTVRLYLPRFRETVGSAVEPTPAAGPAPDAAFASGVTVLVVEDDPMVREFSVAALEDAGYRVLTAEDGPDGLARLDAHPETAVLLTDVVLTGPMNGRQVADEASRRRPDLTVIFTTGYTRNAIIHHGRLDEGVDLIVKPFTASELAEKLRRVLACA